MLIPEHYGGTDWRIEGEILFTLNKNAAALTDEERRKLRHDPYVTHTTTHATVMARTPTEAVEKFAALYSDDVRISKIERKR